VQADAGYRGVEQREEIVALARPSDWQIARQRGAIRKLAVGAEKTAVQAAEKIKASVRAFVPPCHIVKNLFHYPRVRYRGLAKNGHQLDTLFGLANVVIGGRRAVAGT
jgi:IS5 family transposase